MLDDLTAHFTQSDAPGREPGRRWVAELVDATGFCTVPFAVAWLTDYRPMLPVTLDFILVPDLYRRMGYASRLVRDCEVNWPGMLLTDPISPAGEGLAESLETEARDA